MHHLDCGNQSSLEPTQFPSRRTSLQTELLGFSFWFSDCGCFKDLFARPRRLPMSMPYWIVKLRFQVVVAPDVRLTTKPAPTAGATTTGLNVTGSSHAAGLACPISD